MSTSLADPTQPIPVYLLTGFLGSGKTTLLNRMLQSDGPRTAVIVNEFGDVPIDNDLFKVDGTASDLIETSNGCICCDPDNDIASTLSRLSESIDNGEVGEVNRVVIETTGLADPAPIINQMLISSMRSIAGRYFSLASVITTLDAVKGEETVTERLLAHKQLAFADRIALTKADMLKHDEPGRRAALVGLINRINPSAQVFDVQDQAFHPEALLSAGQYAPDAKSTNVMSWLEAESPVVKAFATTPASQWQPGNRHTEIYTRSFTTEHSIPQERVLRFLDMLRMAAGPRLLRLKGLISLADDPDRPYLVHMVQGIFYPPQRLDDWPSEDHSTRLVLIADGIDETALDRYLRTLLPKARKKRGLHSLFRSTE